MKGNTKFIQFNMSKSSKVKVNVLNQFEVMAQK